MAVAIVKQDGTYSYTEERVCDSCLHNAPVLYQSKYNTRTVYCFDCYHDSVTHKGDVNKAY